MSDRRGLWPFLGGLGWGVLALLGVEAVIAVKVLARSGGALKAWADLRNFRKSTPQGTAGPN